MLYLLLLLYSINYNETRSYSKTTLELTEIGVSSCLDIIAKQELTNVDLIDDLITLNSSILVVTTNTVSNTVLFFVFCYFR